MARKVKFDFVPSEYQEKFFDWVEHGVGNALIRAKAGSGKSSTAIASMKLIPKTEKCLFIAFNKSIADHLNEKLKSRPNCTARTTHSLGLLMIKRNLGSDIELDEYKYRNYVKSNITELTTTNGEIKTRQQAEEYIDNITKLIDFSRFNLAQSEREINEIAQKYSIPVSFDECIVVQKCLEWGKTNTETIDYTDMIWLPVELMLKPIGLTYDWVYFDEAQDASLCSIQLFLKCIKRGGRFVTILDEFQSINQFAGASEDAYEFLKGYPNTTLFELPISYRCAKSIIRFANNFVKDIFAREDAPEGIILENCHVRDIKEGDMVLCRSKAPLVNLYVKLLRKNVNCYIKGQDIGQNLIKELEKIRQDDLARDLDRDGVFVRLFDNLFTERNKLMQTRGLDYEDATLSSYIMEKYDAINALMILSERYDSKNELIRHIQEIFKEDSMGVCLSTVHKAKGLESENVYILCNSSMPSRLAVHDWEKQQERNIMYVAYTRAKNKMGFISEKEIKPSGSLQDPSEILTELAYYERKVCDVLGKEPMEKLENTDLLRFKLQNVKQIEDLHKDDNAVNIEEKPITENIDLISELENLGNSMDVVL
jgi:superfamily I DNA/RNA helicase